MRIILLFAALLAPLCGQQRDVFKVDFTIRDTGDAGGKTGRKYSVMVYSQNKGVFKIGNRVPVPTGGSSSVTATTQFTYLDVGVNIECTVQDMGGRIGMRSDIDLSTAVTNEKTPGIAPTISQIRLSIETAIPAAKPTIVASFDDPVTSRKFDVEALVTKVN
jgi:hypothetical protein